MKYLYVLLSIMLLLSLCACVDARAEEGSPAPASAEEEAVELILPDKIPVEEIGGKESFATEETEPAQKDFGTDGWEKPQIELHPVAPDSSEGEIPQPEPVEPPVEEQSQSAVPQDE